MTTDTTRHPSSPSAGFATLALATLLLSACASVPAPDAVWAAPDIGAQARLLQGANVLVACEAPDVAVRNICQDRLAAAVAARGGRPVFVPGDTRLVAGPLDAQLLPSARSENATAILVMTLRPVATEATPSASFSIGGFGFGRGSALGGGLTAPIGETRVATGFSANGRVTNASTGRLVWTASASSPPSEDLPGQLSTLSASVVDAAARAGLF